MVVDHGRLIEMVFQLKSADVSTRKGKKIGDLKSPIFDLADYR